MFELIFNLLQAGGLFILFLLLILEGNPIIGFFIPGSVVVIFYGFFISAQQETSVSTALLVIALGSIIGDIIGFYMGRKLGINALKKFGLNKDSFLYKSSCGFFTKYKYLSIILGRQINFTRAFIPFFAGLSKMREFVFISIAIFSGILWSLLTFLVGYYFGYVALRKFEFFFAFLLFLLVYCAILYYIFRVVKKIYDQNVVTIRRYAFLNISAIILLGFLSLCLLALKNTPFSLALNGGLSFLLFPLGFVSFFTSKLFMFIFFQVLFLIPLYLKKFKLFLIFLWSSFLFIQYTLLSIFFINLFFKLKLSFSVFMITFGFFLLLILLYEKNDVLYTFKRKAVLFLMGFLLLLLLIYSIRYDGDFYRVIISFLIASIGCELLYVLSHYRIVDSHLCNVIKKA